MMPQDNDREIIELLSLVDEEIEYRSLSDSVLIKLAVQTSDPWIATSALGELAVRSPTLTAEAARQILSVELWDSHLAAYALTCLFSADPDAATEHMTRLIHLHGDNSTLLEAMIVNVLSDPDRFEALPLVPRITEQVMAIERERFLDPEQRDRFLARFPPRHG